MIIFGHAPPGVFERDWSSPGTHWLQHSHNIRWLDVSIHPCRLRWSHVSHQAKYNALVVCQPLEFQGLHSTIHFNWSDIWWYLTFNWFKVEHNNFIEPDSKLSLLTFSDIFVWLSSTLMSWWDSSLVTRTLIHSEFSTITSVSFETSLHFYTHIIIYFNQFNNRKKREKSIWLSKNIKNTFLIFLTVWTMDEENLKLSWLVRIGYSSFTASHKNNQKISCFHPA